MAFVSSLLGCLPFLLDDERRVEARQKSEATREVKRDWEEDKSGEKMSKPTTMNEIDVRKGNQSASSAFIL